MPGETPTKWQAQAYRFGVRRLESAVAGGDPLLRSDPVRRRVNITLIVSLVITALLLGVFTIYGFVKPEPSIGNASVVVDKDTGGTFVSRGGRLYPAMNLASALLAAGRGASGDSAPSTTTVDTSAIAKQARGPLLGIPGAPDVLPSASHLVASRWTVCDKSTVDQAKPPSSPPTVRTTAIIGEPDPAGSLGTRGAVLATADGGANVYLIWQGRRSRIAVTDSTIRLAFGLANVTPRPMSAALLNVIPEAADITVPDIAQVSTQPAWADQLGVRVADVFGLRRADGTTTLYVAQPDGVEQVTPLVGELIRDRFDVTKRIPLVSPSALRQAPRSAVPIRTGTYPSVRPQILGSGAYPVVCVSRDGAGGAATSDVSAFAEYVPLPHGAKAVSVTRPGALTADYVYLRPGRGAVFDTATASQTTSGRALYVITDQGVAYPVVSAQALVFLGLGKTAPPSAPPELLDLLPKGPTLDPDTAAHFYPQTGNSASSLPTSAGSGG